MCGRFSLAQTGETIAAEFNLQAVPSIAPRYNIAPTQTIAAIAPAAAKRQLQMLYWGLIPSWAKDKKIGLKTINARAETAAEKPAFRSAFKHRRCLIIADGFYEWQAAGKKKQPYYCQMQDGRSFAFAGLQEHWQGEEGETIDSATIITTAANELMSPIHDRMPVILDSKDWDLWLDREVQDPEKLKPLLQPYPESQMQVYPVSSLVNKAAIDSPECRQQLAAIASE